MSTPQAGWIVTRHETDFFSSGETVTRSYPVFDCAALPLAMQVADEAFALESQRIGKRVPGDLNEGHITANERELYYPLDHRTREYPARRTMRRVLITVSSPSGEK